MTSWILSYYLECQKNQYLLPILHLASTKILLFLMLLLTWEIIKHIHFYHGAGIIRYPTSDVCQRDRHYDCGNNVLEIKVHRSHTSPCNSIILPPQSYHSINHFLKWPFVSNLTGYPWPQEYGEGGRGLELWSAAETQISRTFHISPTTEFGKFAE